MELDWVGQAVSIECNVRLGIFQGIIKDISAESITIVRAFRNGVPLRKQDAEVTLRSTDILKISLIPSYNGQCTLASTVINKPTPVKMPGFNASYSESNSTSASAATTNNILNGIQQPREQNNHQQRPSKDNSSSSMALAKKLSNMQIEDFTALAPYSEQQQQEQNQLTKSTPSTPCNNSVAQFFCNLIPPKVEVRMGSAFSVCSNTTTVPVSKKTPSSLFNMCADALELGGNNTATASKPIDIVGSRSNGHGNGRTHQNGGSSYTGGGGGSSNNSNGNGNSFSYNRSRNGNGGTQHFMNGGYSNGNGGSGNGGGNGSNKNARGQQRKQLRREDSMRQQNHAFATSVDDPLLNEDFDFEGNLALFDKQAIWNVLESGGQKKKAAKKQYRHDENILETDPPQLRGIVANFKGSTDFVTDDGLIIPTIPHVVRSKIEIAADRCGLKFQRQNDMLARGATDVAITILGGARRLTPKNYHQWPKVVIICEKSANAVSANIGAITGRQLASHGIEVLLYLEDNSALEQTNNEISLFEATGNSIVYSVDDLPTTPDLVILSTNSAHLSAEITKWLSENRASIFAIDPPVGGIPDISIKCAILPILPLNGVSAANNCGKLYLCNLGIPEKFYRDGGVKYKSPFGHKFVIPIHPKH